MVLLFELFPPISVYGEYILLPLHLFFFFIFSLPRCVHHYFTFYASAQMSFAVQEKEVGRLTWELERAMEEVDRGTGYDVFCHNCSP